MGIEPTTFRLKTNALTYWATEPIVGGSKIKLDVL